MKAWVFIIFSVSLAGGIINLFTIGTANEKYMKFLCGLACLFAVISPLKQIITAVFDYEPKDISQEISLPDANLYIEDAAKAELEKYIREYLLSNGINHRDICIEITVSDTETVVHGITVFVDAQYLDQAKTALDGIAEVKEYG